MNLDEMLIYADINQVHNIVDNYQCQCDRHSKIEMIQSIIYTILKSDTIEKLINSLNAVEYTFIQLLYFDSRNEYTLEDLLAKSKQAIKLNHSKAKPRELFLSVIKKGWVFQGVGKKNKFVYLVPQDFKYKMITGIKHKLEEKIVVLNNIDFYRDESKLIIADLATFLKYVIAEEVVLTSDGNIYKRQQLTIFKSMLVQEAPLTKIAWRFGYGRRYNIYPDRFSLLYDFAYHQKLIHEDEEGYLFITPSGGKWLNKYDYSEEEQKLYKFWLRLYKHPIPYLQIAVKIIDLIGLNRWILIGSLEEKLLFWIKDFYYEDKQLVFKDRLIKMLFHLGIVQIGNYQNDTYLRVTNQGHKWINETVNFDLKELILK